MPPQIELQLTLRMIKHAVLLPLLLLNLALPVTAADGPAPPPDYRFHVEVLAEGMPQPMELEVAPDGRIFINELNGPLKIWRPGTNGLSLAGTVPVFHEQENGFLGFALDPQFASNQWIYLFYSPKDFVGARLSRFNMDGDTLVLSSERRILQFPEQRRECCHHAGSVEFGPDGNLFISTGDNTHPGGDSDGYAPIDERPDRDPFDAQKSSANTHDLRGKILRIRPQPEGGYAIPDGNLFPKDGSKGRPEIYVMGCRNPWRMSVDPGTGIVYWGEVGPDAGGDGRRGSRGYDEINQARHAGNFGWPYFVGSNSPYADWDFATKAAGPIFDARFPTNASPNNTGARILPPAQPAFIYWPYGESKEFPSLGSGGRTACAGPVYRFRPEFRHTSGFPEHFDGCLLFFDWQRPFMKWARLDSESRLLGVEPFTSAVSLINDRTRANKARIDGEFVIQRPVDAQFGPDGCLYLLDFGETWGANADSRLLRISYRWGNLPPVARLSASPAAGREPLTVALSSAGSVDHEGDALSHEWILNPPGKPFSTQPHPRITLTNAGNHVIELRVSDVHGLRSSATLTLTVGNTRPEIRFLRPQDGDFFTPGESIYYEIAVKDAEDGTSEENDEWMGPRTFVGSTWSRGDGKSVDVEPGVALMKQSDCFNCHGVERKIIGPGFLEIAAKYRNQDGALEASVQRVIKGSTRVWGDVPMLPHESMHPDQVRIMVRWIFGLEPGKAEGGAQPGLMGTLQAPKDERLRSAHLEASFTDGGRGPAGSLSGSTSLTLRSRRLEAELADEKIGLKTLGSAVGGIDHGHGLKFKSLNLSDSKRVRLRVASGGHGGRIELRTGSPEGALVSQVMVEPTGGWDKWIELESPIDPQTGRTDLWVGFVNPGKGGLMNLDWLTFLP